MNKEHVLMTGSDGMLGLYFDFGIRTDHRALDITNLSMVMKKCLEYKPEVIVHLAGLTDLTVCEQDPSLAYFINTIGTYNVALAAREVGAKFVYVSTSGVFDGTKKTPYTEEDVPHPVNVYGHSKYLGELVVSGMLDDYLIVRASWLFGGGEGKDKKFVGKIIKQLNETEIKAVADRRGSPTYAKDLAVAILKLIAENKKGIYHLNNGGNATRYDVAKEIVSLMGVRTTVVPVASVDFALAYTSGANESMTSKTPYMRPWKEALREYIETEWNIVLGKAT